MDNRTGRPLWGGFVLLLIGVIFLFNNFHILPGDFSIGRWWPLILIIIGLSKLFGSRCPFDFSGWFLILLGVVFLLTVQNRFGFGWSNFWRLWPGILILLGLSMLLGRRSRLDGPRVQDAPQSEEGRIRERVVLGGVEKEIQSDDFRGGDIESVLGSVELDLRRAKMMGDSATLTISSVLGNVELRLPREWTVELKSRTALGSVENNTHPPIAAAGVVPKKIILITSTVLGSVEIDN